jgi:hypothetical protein
MDVIAVVVMILLVISTAAGARNLEGFLQRNGASVPGAWRAKLLGYVLAILLAALLAAYVVSAITG